MLNKKKALYLVFFILVISLAIFFSSFSNANNIIGDNYRNVTVTTRVTISNSNPEVLEVIVYQETNNSLLNVTLNAGSLRNITCNATIRDWNGYGDITGVNATLWHITTSSRFAPDDNNSHYTTNCINSGNGINYTVNYLCIFPVYYYANNGTWNCSVMAIDTYNKTGNNSNTTYVYPLYALNVTDGIDYGNVAVDDDSLTKAANVTNFGNMPINISVEGYGAVRGDGLAMNCSIFGNISVEYERFSIVDTGNWIDKTPLSSTAQLISNLTIPKQTLPSTPMVNTTYWQLRVPPNPAGNCTGYIIFQAEAP
ncbi:MAG: hypothetical protein KatS3mg002_1214 [Candidatus Woesearchaeota archaeon]|nr:MAG: hypothetical protein KatS3mg002_1214 [Candidatus Woesearchaeota archaeon]